MRSLPGTDFSRQLPESDALIKAPWRLWQRLHLDPWLLLFLLLITVVGLWVLNSASAASEHMIKRQIIFFAIGYTAMFCVAQLPIGLLRHSAKWIYAVGVVLLILVLLIGVGAKGAQRWLSLGFIRFQPSEMLKLGLPLFLSAYFAARVLPPSFSHVCVGLFLIAIPAVLIFLQPDLGTAIMISASGLAVLFFAGLRWRYIVGSLLLVVVASYPMWHFFMHDYQKRRILTLLDPEADRLGSGWNIIQAKTAIGSGGLSGKGYKRGTQSQLDFLPESHTDFIVAVLAEEEGLQGVIVLLGLYLLVVFRGFIIAWRAPNHFSRLLAASLSITFFCYVFVNMGMVSGILPVVGVPLPMVSLGGTALVTLLAGFGLIMAVATQPRFKNVEEH